MVTRGNDLSFPARSVGLLWGLCPWCCRANGSLCRSPGRRAAWPPVPSGQRASRRLLSGGQRGLSAAMARVRGGRINVTVAWRRARRLGRLCRRHQPPPGDAGQMPGCPGRAPTRIRHWCAHCVPADACDRVPGGIRYTARHQTITRLPPRGRPGGGMIPAQPSPAPSPPWPGSDRTTPGIPGAVGIAWRD